MKYFIANWKMNMSIKEIVSWVEEFSKIKLVDQQDRKIIICPSQPHIPLIKEFSNEMGFLVGAQDVSVFEKGAHTGETGSFQLTELCTYVLVGHSERKETPDVVIQKRDAAIKAGITPIICFVDIANITKINSKGVLLAWEDPNNISLNGVYREKDPADIENGINSIRSLVSHDTSVIYGGSVNRENIKALNKIKGIDGVLVGNAGLDPEHFADIINSCI
jgi:triosephosphate isomerase